MVRNAQDTFIHVNSENSRFYQTAYFYHIKMLKYENERIHS